MPTITITITGGHESEVEEYENACPLPTQDPELNSENREVAVEEAGYREATSSDACANCGAYDQTEDMLECIGDESGDLGYCRILGFVCEGSNTCDRWVEGGPITELPDDGYGSLAEYEPRDVF